MAATSKELSTILHVLEMTGGLDVTKFDSGGHHQLVLPLTTEFQSGDTKGPFHVKKRTDRRTICSGIEITLIDQLGLLHVYEVLDRDPIIQRIKACSDPRTANAIAYFVCEDQIQMTITKDIRHSEPILTTILITPIVTSSTSSSMLPETIPMTMPTILPADKMIEVEKPFACDQCGLAKFKNIDNLIVHQQQYCKKVENNQLPNSQALKAQIPVFSNGIIPSVSTTTPATSPTFLLPLGLTNPLTSSNIVLLPVAQHNETQQDLIQILGPAQTFIPIAVGKQNFKTNSLILQKSACNSIRPPSSINFNHDGISVTVPMVHIDMPSTSTSVFSPSSTVTSSTPTATTTTPTSLTLKRPADRSSAALLDFEKRLRQTVQNTTDLQKPTISRATPPSLVLGANGQLDIEKPFLCTCGVTFQSSINLTAHKQYYCKHVERPEDHREPTRKLPSRCSQCSYEPQSISQLSLHIRNVHNDVRAYVCKECGYRGYSIRGIRSHMRTHPSLEYLKFDALLAEYVTEIKGSDTASNGDSDTEVIVT